MGRLSGTHNPSRFRMAGAPQSGRASGYATRTAGPMIRRMLMRLSSAGFRDDASANNDRQTLGAVGLYPRQPHWWNLAHRSISRRSPSVDRHRRSCYRTDAS